MKPLSSNRSENRLENIGVEQQIMRERQRELLDAARNVAWAPGYVSMEPKTVENRQVEPQHFTESAPVEPPAPEANAPAPTATNPLWQQQLMAEAYRGINEA